MSRPSLRRAALVGVVLLALVWVALIGARSRIAADTPSSGPQDAGAPSGPRLVVASPRSSAAEAATYPAAGTPWEEAAFALAEVEGKDVVRCALGAVPSGELDGAGLLMLEHVELRGGVLTAIVADPVPYEGRAVGVVGVGGEPFELRLQRARNAPVAACGVEASTQLSVEDWPQIERTDPDGSVVTEDWPFAALAPEDVRTERDGLDKEQSALQAVLADPDVSSDARRVLEEWLRERSAALDRAENEAGTFILR